ncbi:hypothetical protein [Fibrella forsythiae]|uniref:Uncharacterized protein n=1 Tax=Fibrella forsythiae TaxID=2817061 RepID=A0ABS3JTC2_9BACT|nr:hypothetical protein [Fibrella forsythiae]MBO0953257.1 hypothetical protein [Fibrella forsythiae]
MSTYQKVTASQNWRERMREARASLPEGVGQQDVLVFITAVNSEIDRLIYATRWRNAWSSKVSDPEFTQLVEQAAEHFVQKQ